VKADTRVHTRYCGSSGHGQTWNPLKNVGERSQKTYVCRRTSHRRLSEGVKEKHFQSSGGRVANLADPRRRPERLNRRQRQGRRRMHRSNRQVIENSFDYDYVLFAWNPTGGGYWTGQPSTAAAWWMFLRRLQRNAYAQFYSIVYACSGGLGRCMI
jgi:hypothetical protein